MSSIFDLSGKTVVITGGMGQLGKQYVKALQSAGANIVVIDIDVTKNESYLQQNNLDSKCVQFIECDITSRLSLENALEIIKTNGSIHGLINNAALDSPPGANMAENGPFEFFPEESWDRVIDVNLKGVFLTCQVLGSYMASHGSGSIVNIGSVYGLVSPDQRIYEYMETDERKFVKPIAYSASKSGLINMTRYLATYWAKAGVRINLLTLGGVFNDQDEKFLEGYCSRVPMGRMANEDEFNGACIFLISNASSYMTGANLVMDGGWTSW